MGLAALCGRPLPSRAVTGRGVLRTGSCAIAAAAVVLVLGVSSAGSASARPQRSAATTVLKLATPAPGHVKALVVLFTRPATSRAPRITLVGRYPVQPRVALVGGLGRSAASQTTAGQTQWVGLVTIANFKRAAAMRTLAAVKRPAVARIRVERPFKATFLGNVLVDHATTHPVVVDAPAFAVPFKRVSKLVPDPYGLPGNLLNEVRRALAGIPSEAFATAVLGHPPAGG
jgi:hypothetical protein